MAKLLDSDLGCLYTELVMGTNLVAVSVHVVCVFFLLLLGSCVRSVPLRKLHSRSGKLLSPVLSPFPFSLLLNRSL